MADWASEPFAKHHDWALFCCGQPPLDDFIRSRVRQDEKRRLGKTFVAVPAGKTRVNGYDTLAAGAVMFDQLPAKAVQKIPACPVATEDETLPLPLTLAPSRGEERAYGRQESVFPSGRVFSRNTWLMRRLAVWSGPRNLSTALMRSFSSRTDCVASDEPFYAAYLAACGRS